MESNVDTLTVWKSGRLAPHRVTRRPQARRAQWIAAALLALCACELALFVGVLEQDIHRVAMQRDAERVRAVAQARCEADPSAELRSQCLALFNSGGAPAGDAAATALATGRANPDRGTTAMVAALR